MNANFPEMEPLDPNAQKAFDDLIRQQQARPASTNRQQGLPSSQYPQSQTYVNNQRMAMANSSYTTPSFTHASTLQIPPTEAGLGFQPSFPYGYGQAQQHGSTYIPFPDALSDSDFILNNAQSNSFQSEQLAPAYTPLPSTHHSANTTQPQSMPSVAEGPGSSFIDLSSPIDATTIEPQSMTTVPAPGPDGLRFRSRATASETCDLLYREVFEIKNDDVIEVEQNKEQHVKSFVKALNHKGFMAAPDTRMVGKGEMKTLNATEKQAWVHWQIGACKSVEIRMAQPNVDVNLERRAWEVFDEIVKAHNVGFRLSSLTKDAKSTCSKRIKDALQVIESHAILRQKILDGDKLSDFAVNPEDYARRTRTHHYNNAERAAKLKAAKDAREGATAAAGQAGAGNASGGPTAATAGAGTSQGRRAASSTGAVARRSMPRKDLKLLKKEEASKGDKTKSGATVIGTASETLTAAMAEEQTGNPDLFLPEPVQLQGQEISRPPPLGINDFIDFPDNWSMSSALRPPSPGSTGYSISNVANGADYFPSGFGGGNISEHRQASPDMPNQLRRGEVADSVHQRAASSYDAYGVGSLAQANQALPRMQGQRHRVGVTGYPNQLATATYDTYGAVPTGGPTEHSQASVSIPKESTRKRPRIG